MELVVDLERVTVVLVDASDAGDVRVRVGAPGGASPGSDADVHRLHDVLVSAYVGRLEGPREAVVRADAIRFHAAGQVEDGWDERFGRLCADRALETELQGEEATTLRAVVRWPGDQPGDQPDG